MVRLMKEKRFPAAFKCYYNYHKINSISSDDLHYKMVIHVHSDSAFRRYQKEMRSGELIIYIYALHLATQTTFFNTYFPHIVCLYVLLTCVYCPLGTSQTCGRYIEVNCHATRLTQMRYWFNVWHDLYIHMFCF